MEETISTTVETPEVQTTPDVVENQTTETIEENSDVQSDAAQESENADVEAIEKVEADENTEESAKEEPAKNWEQIAKDNQAAFTRVTQELAELKKQVAENQPKMVVQGKINPEFEKQYKFQVDNEEFLQYDDLARKLEPDQRNAVEDLLLEAKRLYDPNNRSAYEQRMAQVKDYFRSDLVESIAKDKLTKLNQIEAKFNEALAKDKQDRAQKVAASIQAVPELNELVAQESENYSPDVFGIVKTIFDFTGKIDIESTTKAIQKIKELGVKEYIAKQQAEEIKAKANVPTGNNVAQSQENKGPTAEMVSKNYNRYLEEYQKKGLSFHDAMAKLDEIIMKGN